jgi:heme/copper-type cytochrome/quinol oxidase subunit 4
MYFEEVDYLIIDLFFFYFTKVYFHLTAFFSFNDKHKSNWNAYCKICGVIK